MCWERQGDVEVQPAVIERGKKGGVENVQGKKQVSGTCEKKLRYSLLA